jgi:pantothenate kinase
VTIFFPWQSFCSKIVKNIVLENKTSVTKEKWKNFGSVIVQHKSSQRAYDNGGTNSHDEVRYTQQHTFSSNSIIAIGGGGLKFFSTMPQQLKRKEKKRKEKVLLEHIFILRKVT